MDENIAFTELAAVEDFEDLAVSLVMADVDRVLGPDFSDTGDDDCGGEAFRRAPRVRAVVVVVVVIVVVDSIGRGVIFPVLDAIPLEGSDSLRNC